MQTFSFENEYKKTIKVELSLSQGIAIFCSEFAVNTPAVHLLFFPPGNFTQIKARSHDLTLQITQSWPDIICIMPLHIGNKNVDCVVMHSLDFIR